MARSWAFRAMGTVGALAVPAAVDPARHRAALRLVVGELAALEARFSAWRPDSEAAAYGRGEVAEPSALLVEVLAACGRLHAESGGAFAPALVPGTWASRAGNGASAGEAVGAGPGAGAGTAAGEEAGTWASRAGAGTAAGAEAGTGPAAGPPAGFRDGRWTGPTAGSGPDGPTGAVTGVREDGRVPGALDLSGYVKGWAVDRAGVLLADEPDWCLSLGGDVLARGSAGGRPWQVAVRDPRSRAGVATVVRIPETGGAVATSGRYERGDHVWDLRPGRGRPPGAAAAPGTGTGPAAAPGGPDAAAGARGARLTPGGPDAAAGARPVLSFTATAPTLAEADACATAGLVMGIDGLAWAGARPGVEAVAVMGDGSRPCTPGFLGQLAAARGAPPRRVAGTLAPA